MVDHDVLDDMQVSAQAAVHWAKEMFDIHLDFSEESIQAVEMILEKLGHRLPQSLLARLWNFHATRQESIEMAIVWGSYLGEVMRLQWDGEWVAGGKPNQALLQVQEIAIAPIETVQKRLNRCLEVTISEYYQNFKRSLELVSRSDLAKARMLEPGC